VVIDVNPGFSSWIEIEPVSPVFIGSDEKIERFETIVEGNMVYILDFQKLLGRDDFVELFVAKMQDILDPSVKDRAMKEIFQKLNLKLSEVSLDSFPAQWRNNKPDNLQMKRFVRSAGRYYVPGSSIKGAIRTALIRSDQSLVRRFEDLLKTIVEDSMKESKQGMKREKKRNIKIERVIFRSPNQSPFRLLEISDSDFIDKKFVKFKLITVRNLLNVKTKIPMMLELWLDNQDESNKVRVLLQSRVDRLSQMKNWITDPGKLLETLGDKGKFIEAVKSATEKIIQLEIERIKKALNSNEFKLILSFYEKLREENKKMRDGFILRLGAQTGFFSKTFFTRFLNRNELEFLKSTHKVYRKINENLFPVSISIAEPSYESPVPKPLGWVRVRFVS